MCICILVISTILLLSDIYYFNRSTDLYLKIYKEALRISYDLEEFKIELAKHGIIIGEDNECQQ